ncbi:hypothetical protein J2751_001310 [Halorubrum alkaliphilum]|uniref:DUF7974 domain-containing protein n=1 Tax=Halorubrum alkaliphilum TaxID=261290 RepID=A0A8T4GGL0_9EURY|nr:hypothetical protein [Halorubrum alkaliphilum]MBP1922302.1 hypothetical protein [Halorubrum alkaliphilum]
MRRIYESDAVERDRSDPFRPGDAEEGVEPQAARSITSSAWSKRLLPHWLRHRVVTVDVTAERTHVGPAESVPFTVTFTNRLPIPVSVEVRSPLLWTWSVDGHVEASRVPVHDPPDGTAYLNLDRGERRRFRREWSGLFRISDREWDRADRGEHTLRVAVNVADPDGKGLADETTITVE